MKIKIVQFFRASSLVILMACFTLLNSASATAQNGSSEAKRKIMGNVVSSDTQEPIVGATVISQDGINYAITDENGDFTINASNGEILEVSYIGFNLHKLQVTNQSIYNINLLTQEMDEVVVVGYGVQKRASITGSIASVGGDDIVQTKNTNIQNGLAGRVPGLRVSQNSSEPGTFTNEFDIRGLGTPLIVIDGVIRGTMTRLDANEIESFTILKDASAAIYGVQAANGVVLITTKSGSNTGKAEISYNASFTRQYVSNMPETVDVVTYLTMMNEKNMASSNGQGTLLFSLEDIEKYRTGEYSSYNWNDAVIADYASQMQHNVNISGGNEKTNYFVNLGYQYQDSFLKSGDLTYDRYNLRAKLGSKINDNLSFDINLAGIMDKKNSPYYSTYDIIRATWKQYPYDPIYANDNEDYYYLPTTDETDNPVAMMDADYVGYKEYINKWFQSNASLTYEVPFIEGLNLKAMMSYDYTISNNTEYKKSYSLYRYDGINDMYEATQKQNPSTIKRYFQDQTKVTYQLSANYMQSFVEDKHNVTAQFIVDGSKSEGDNFYAQRELSIDLEYLFAGNDDEQIGSMYSGSSYLYETASIAYIGRLNYDYMGKYLVEFVGRYDGSSKFSTKKRFGFFPSVLGGYRISEEEFWKNSALNFISDLKIRASYGVMGDDGALDYQYLSGFTYPSNSSYFDGTLVNGISESSIPNLDITWYTAKTMNAGVDFQLFNGKFGGSYDVFKRDREGLLTSSTATLPGTVGASISQQNLNSDRTYGAELMLYYRNQIGDLRYYVSGNASVTREMYLHVEETEQRGQYHVWQDSSSYRYKDMWWGYGIGGQYQSYDEIAESSVKSSVSDLPGSYYYEDWNGDGVIDKNDMYPMGFLTTPPVSFGFNINLAYKGFDLDILLQGSAMGNVMFTEKLNSAFSNVFAPLDFWSDRWYPTDPTANPYDYSTEWNEGTYAHVAATSALESSAFNVHSTDYIRLKNIELGYTIPEKILSQIGIKDLRVYISGYNLLTITNLEIVDPEFPSDNYGYNYPLNKTVTLGLNLKF